MTDSRQLALDLLAPLYLGMAASRNSDGSDDASIINIRETISALKADIAAKVEPVGSTSAMPGTSGFTIACFKSVDMPVGTKLYVEPQQSEAPGWIPIETAPKDGTEILLCAEVTLDLGICYWREDKVMTGWTWGLGKMFGRPTHWMPLPAAPRSKA